MATSCSVFVVLSASGVLMATVSFGVSCYEEVVETEGLVLASSLVGFPQADERRNKRTEKLGEEHIQTGKATDKQRQTQTAKRYSYSLRK